LHAVKHGLTATEATHLAVLAGAAARDEQVLLTWLSLCTNGVIPASTRVAPPGHTT
jgi:hypothetical protein